MTSLKKKREKLIQSREREWQQAALEKNHLKFCSVTMEHVLMDSLMWLPAIAWNMIAVILVNKFFPPGKNPAESDNFTAKLVYAIIITLVVSTIIYFYYKHKINIAIKTVEVDVDGK